MIEIHYWLLLMLFIPRNTKAGCDLGRVCKSTINVGHGVTMVEGNYCSCKACDNPSWDVHDKSTFTWYHHEKHHWQIQYRFCQELTETQCQPGSTQVAAIIRSNITNWEPTIHQMNCRCPSELHYMLSWGIAEGKHWDYVYVCKLPQCAEDVIGAPGPSVQCVSRTLDSTKERVLSVQFLCNCAQGKSCPSFDDDARDKKGVKLPLSTAQYCQ